MRFDLVRIWKRGTLRAGEYRFDHPASATEVYARIARGDVFTKTLTVPEGANIFDIAARVEQAGFGTRQEFLDAAVERDGVGSRPGPWGKEFGGLPVSGHLPFFTARQRRRRLQLQWCGGFHVVAGQLGLKENVHQVVTIASLVERETAVDAERPLVASVFMNRLEKKMPLMTDPAVIYGLELEGHWRGTLLKSDLAHNTAYNTYLNNGLPPGPVANPGVRSLRAAMEPAQTTYFYFVAAGANAQGHSLFSSTLDEHDRNRWPHTGRR